MRVLTSAPFDPDMIDGIRRQFTDEVVAAVPDAVQTNDFEATIANLRGWQYVDKHNAHLLRSVLYVYRKFNEYLWSADDGLTRVAENVAAAARILAGLGVPPPAPAGVAGYVGRLMAMRPGGLPPDALTAEIARHEFWGGWVSDQLASQRLSWASSPGSRRDCEQGLARAVRHFALARRLDPHLALDSYYSDLPSIEANTESRWGQCLMAKKDYVGAAQHCRRATTLDPSNANCFRGLAQVLLRSSNMTGTMLAEAEQAISRADALGADVEMLRKLLEILRRRNL